MEPDADVYFVNRNADPRDHRAAVGSNAVWTRSPGYVTPPSSGSRVVNWTTPTATTATTATATYAGPASYAGPAYMQAPAPTPYAPQGLWGGGQPVYLQPPTWGWGQPGTLGACSPASMV